MGEELNERQRAYLLALFDGDQAAEAHRRQLAARRIFDDTPAAEWRKVMYGPVAPPSALYSTLHRAGMVDSGTGSTWASLARRGLLTTHIERDAFGAELLAVRLTPKGRKLARELTGQAAPKRLPAGLLRLWHWRALVAAWEAGAEGLGVTEDLPGEYGGHRWETWLRLRDYKGGGLIVEASNGGRRPWSITVGYLEGVRLYITERGRQHYRDHWRRYRELYPEVDAPAPGSAEQGVGDT